MRKFIAFLVSTLLIICNLFMFAVPAHAATEEKTGYWLFTGVTTEDTLDDFYVSSESIKATCDAKPGKFKLVQEYKKAEYDIPKGAKCTVTGTNEAPASRYDKGDTVKIHAELKYKDNKKGGYFNSSYGISVYAKYGNGGGTYLDISDDSSSLWLEKDEETNVSGDFTGELRDGKNENDEMQIVVEYSAAKTIYSYRWVDTTPIREYRWELKETKTEGTLVKISGWNQYASWDRESDSIENLNLEGAKTLEEFTVAPGSFTSKYTALENLYTTTLGMLMTQQGFTATWTATNTAPKEMYYVDDVATMTLTATGVYTTTEGEFEDNSWDRNTSIFAYVRYRDGASTDALRDSDKRGDFLKSDGEGTVASTKEQPSQSAEVTYKVEAPKYEAREGEKNWLVFTVKSEGMRVDYFYEWVNYNTTYPDSGAGEGTTNIHDSKFDNSDDDDPDDKTDYVIDKPAEENPGEDDGTFIPSDIFKKIPVVPGAVAVISAVGAASGDPDSEKKKKAKEKSAYKMYINKNFGNTLSKGAKDQPVYARIVEVKPSGEEVDRKDMTAKIQVFSGDGSLIVTDGGMTSNGYKAAYASVPVGAENGKGQVSFRFEAEEGSFTQNVIFDIIVPAIKFFQDNLTLPAVVMDKPKYLPFAVEGMGEDYEVELEISGEDYEVEVALNDDPEAKHAFFAGIIEVNKDPAPAGVYTESWLKVKAKNSEQTVEGELKVIRMHLGLFVSANAINCYRMVKKEASGKTCKELRKEDYEAALTEFRAYLLVSDEKTYEVSQLAAFPTMKITPLDDEKDPKVKEALDAMKIEMGFVKVEDGFSVFAFRCSNGFLDSPTRYKVKLSMSQDYTYVKGEGEDAKEVTVTYTCDKEVLLRSQPVRNLTKMEDMTTFHKNDQTIGDRLTYIRMMIWENNWYDHLFPVINMIDRMEDGFSVNYGWDPYQVWKVNDVFERFERGELLGANAEPVTYGVADDLEALAAGTRSWDGWQGIVLRMSLAYMTVGASEAVLLVMDVNRAAMDYRKETGGKGTPFGYFKAGVVPVLFAAGFKFAPAIGRNIGKGAKYLAPKQSAQLAAKAKQFAQIAVETGQEAKKLVGGMIPNGAKSVSGKVMNAVTELVEKVDKYDPRISLSKADLAAKTITAGTSQARAEADSLIKQAQNAQKTLDEKILDAAGKAANNEGRVLYNDVVAAKKALQAAPTDPKLIQKYNQSLVKFKASHAAIEYGNSVSPGKDLAIRGAINADLESNLNSKLVGKMQTKLSVKYELDPKNVKFDRATANKSAGVKFGRDLDLTGKNCTMNENPKYFSQATMDECLETSTREVIAEQCGEEFAEQFAKEGQFARKMDYTACTPQHADYFKGGLDTVKVVTDLEHMGESLGKNTAKSAGQTLKYKGLHPYKEGLALEQATLKGMSDAEKLALLQELETATSGEAKALANLDLSPKAKQILEAYGLMEEGIYQPAKYGDKIISKDWLMLKNGHPETLSSNDYLFNRLGERATGLGRANDAIRGLDQIGVRISITDTRKVLKMRGTSVEEMIENMGNNFEKLDKLAGISQDAAISDAMSNVKSALDLAMAVKSDSQKGKKDNG